MIQAAHHTCRAEKQLKEIQMTHLTNRENPIMYCHTENGVTRQNRTAHKKGFTLIELLVVIAIISILASILFPVFARARENARRASCLNNMKQIGLGLMQYYQDYDERGPFTFGWDEASGAPNQLDTDVSRPAGYFTIRSASVTGHYKSWMDYIYPYVKSVQVFVCPSVKPSVGTAPVYASYGYSTAFGGYFNDISKYCGGGGCRPNWTPLSLADVQRVSEITMVMDVNTFQSMRATPGYIRGLAISTNGDQKLVSPHLEGGSYVYADGHAKWQSLAKIRQIPAGTGNCTPTASPLAVTAFCDKSWNPFIQ
jgi:prepilin-type N-terminal cleavage/methylation domain-containing protein